MARHLGSKSGTQTELFRRIGKGGDAHRTSVRLPQGARQEMMREMADRGYGLRDKSRWVADTVREFLSEETWKAQGLSSNAWKRLVVDTECVRAGRPVVETLQVPAELHVDLWQASIDAALWGANQEEPVYLEISIASVLRAAILWRLGLMEDS